MFFTKEFQAALDDLFNELNVTLDNIQRKQEKQRADVDALMKACGIRGEENE